MERSANTLRATALLAILVGVVTSACGPVKKDGDGEKAIHSPFD
jgi:hypothetical protein